MLKLLSRSFECVSDLPSPNFSPVGCTTRFIYQVVDVGCVEGSLLTVLCSPAPLLATPEQDSTEPFKTLRINHLHCLDIPTTISKTLWRL